MSEPTKCLTAREALLAFALGLFLGAVVIGSALFNVGHVAGWNKSQRQIEAALETNPQPQQPE